MRYEGVTFRFRNSDQGVFDVDLEAPAGQTVALVGPTGAGKTTTLALLQRLRAPDGGPHHRRRPRHRRRDADLAAPATWRWCSRTRASSTARSPRTSASAGRKRRDAEVEQAARLAEAHDFICQEARRLPVRHRRARRLAVGRRAPAHRHRARHPQGRADPDPRRGHQRARRGDRGPHQARARPAAVAGAPPSSSPTGCPRSPTPTASWCSMAGASSSAAPSASWWRTRGLFARLVAEGGFTEPAPRSRQSRRRHPDPGGSTSRRATESGRSEAELLVVHGVEGERKSCGRRSCSSSLG